MSPTLRYAPHRASNYVVTATVTEQGRKFFHVIFSRDGSVFVAFPYFDDSHGIMSVARVPGDAKSHFTIELMDSRVTRRLDSRAGFSQAQKAADLPLPTTSSLVSRTHAGIRRTLGTAQPGKTPALVDDLKRMLDGLPGTRVGLRGRALLLLGFAGAFRRSELVSLDVADLDFSRAGLIVTLRQSKKGPEGEEPSPWHSLWFVRANLPCQIAAELAQIGAHRRSAGLQVAGSVSAGAGAAAVG